MMDDSLGECCTKTFGAVAAYARTRLGPRPTACDGLPARARPRSWSWGAGTGTLTATLLEQGRLRMRIPTPEVIQATAERIPPAASPVDRDQDPPPDDGLLIDFT